LQKFSGGRLEGVARFHQETQQAVRIVFIRRFGEA
jgi:hypothetical protein